MGHQPQTQTRVLRLGDRGQGFRRTHHGPVCRPTRDRDFGHREGRHTGQAGTTERIDNYPGFVEGIGYNELVDQKKADAVRFDVEILPAQAVTQIQTDGDYKSISTESGD